MQCPPPPAVTHLLSGQTGQLLELMAQPSVTAQPLVLDLGGHVFEIGLGTSTSQGKLPQDRIMQFLYGMCVDAVTNIFEVAMT